MNSHSRSKPSLPSIKDLLEGGPGLIDPRLFSHVDCKCKSHLSRHRRHVSEQIATSSNPLNSEIPIKMESLSLQQEKPTTNRTRTHSRSYSDFTHPYPRHIDLNVEDSIETKQDPPPLQQDNGYICSYCNKGFTRPSSLRTHTYSHTGEKPFICTEPCCGRKFSVQSNLRRHLRVHRLSKPAPLFLPKNIK